MKTEQMERINLRKYDLVELDQMRKFIRTTLRYGISEDASAKIEDQLRTHMLNGTSVAELERYADLKQIERLEQRVFGLRIEIINFGSHYMSGTFKIKSVADGLWRMRKAIIEIEVIKTRLGL